ncbi:MAG: hypothetical protein JWM20_689 [Patescibacteria group bacterium]|nr:hypothetical protein [Patescibacteria group bacterium]
MDSEKPLNANDLIRFSRVIPREYVFLNGLITRETILIPKELYEATLIICEDEKDLHGVLVMEPTPFGFKVCMILTLGYIIANPLEDIYVYDEERQKAVNLMVDSFKGDGVKMLHWSGRKKSTSPLYHDRFHEMDYDLIFKFISKDENYDHIKFTKTNFMTCGMNDLNVAVSRHKDNSVFGMFQKFSNEYRSCFSKISLVDPFKNEEEGEFTKKKIANRLSKLLLI